MAIFLALMFAAGIGASLGTCELEFSQSFLHYAIYFVVTLVLALIAGGELAQPLSKRSATDPYGLPQRSSSVPLPQTNVPPAVPNPTP